MNRINTKITLALLLAAALLAGCERPPVDAVQRGYRGLGMEHLSNPRQLDASVRANIPPEPIPAVAAAGGKASDVYQNVQLLGDLSVAEFTRLMAAITAWVAPEEGCTYCHAGNNFAEDDLYTKQVARVMLGMTRQLNSEWSSHVGDTGVTCYTCHRGQPVPAEGWTIEPGRPHTRSLAGSGQNIAAPAAAYASLPSDPFTPFFGGDGEIRLQSDSALPTGNRKGIKQAEWTYSLMMHFSDALGVNCTYCHNSRSFSNWEESPATRVTAWHGISMVRQLNSDYINATGDLLPAHRKGPMGDPLKVNCATCHQGAYKPLYGARMIEDYPSLARGK